MRKSEFAIALVALAGVTALGVQQGVMIAVVLSLVERLRRQYHPHDEILLQDQVYAPWAADRFKGRKHLPEAPAGLLIYRFNDAIFFENATYFLKRITSLLKKAKMPVKSFVLDGSAISDIDYTAAQTLKRLSAQLDAADIQFGIAHVSPFLKSLLKRYGLIDVIGANNIYPSVRFAIEAYTKHQVTSLDRIQALHLNQDEYVVIGGAVLDLLGIRNTNDVDLVVNKETYHRLAKKSTWKEYIQDNGKRILSRSGYKIMINWMGRNLADLQEAAVTIDGIPVMHLDDLIKCKTQLGREKDIIDIARIKNYESISHTNAYQLNPALVPAR